MKRILAALLVVAGLHILGSNTFSADSPLAVTHKMTRYQKGAKLVALSYTLHVVNRGDKALADVTLRVVPSPFFRGKSVLLNIGNLAAHQVTDVSVELQTPPTPAKEKVSQQPLFLAGKCLDSDGDILEFPAKSYPGGTR